MSDRPRNTGGPIRTGGTGGAAGSPVGTLGGRDHPQGEFEVTAGRRVRYPVDEPRGTAHLVYAAPRRPEDTD
ncbi:hypothetical protein ACFWV1_07230 [Streptomyces sp. NPDC058700]|uniref:hypothetical protein n=1 Tax=unclassified Streptomyces TaxID=2593676 RepID=UPI00364F2ED7